MRRNTITGVWITFVVGGWLAFVSSQGVDGAGLSARGSDADASAVDEPVDRKLAPGQQEPAKPDIQMVDTDVTDESGVSVDQWLERIEARAGGVRTLRAQLRYDRIQGLVGDRQRRFGELIYTVGPPARFAVHFDRLLVDRRLDRQDRWYIFDGRWLVERYDDQKLFIKRQITPPPSVADGSEPVEDPLAWGAGPFVLPVTQKKDQVLQRFEVTMGDPVGHDPEQVGRGRDPGENSVHLVFTPKPGRRVDYARLDIWYDRQTLLPVRVRTLDGSENESVVDLSDTRLNEVVDEQVLSTDEPTERGWRVEVSPYETQPSVSGG